jgi:SET domain
LKANKQVGRFLVAARDIKAGEHVIREIPNGAVLFQQYVSSHCSNCFNALGNTRIACDGCKSQYIWCSQECREASLEVHSLVCGVYRNIASIAGSSRSDDALIRVSALTLAQLHHSRTVHGIPAKANPEQVTQMVAHSSMASTEWIRSITEAAKDMIELLPAYLKIGVDDIVKIAMQINANSHAVYEPSRTIDCPIGVGVFPLAALANHSCMPNINYVTASGGVMEFVALHDIAEGEEICAFYTGYRY